MGPCGTERYRLMGTTSDQVDSGAQNTKLEIGKCRLTLAPPLIPLAQSYLAVRQ